MAIKLGQCHTFRVNCHMTRAVYFLNFTECVDKQWNNIPLTKFDNHPASSNIMAQEIGVCLVTGGLPVLACWWESESPVMSMYGNLASVRFPQDCFGYNIVAHQHHHRSMT